MTASAELDIEVHDAMLEHGLAFMGDYTPAGETTSTQVRVYLERGVVVRGEFGQSVGRRDELLIVCPGLAAKAGARVAVENADKTGTESFVLTDKLEDDDLVSRWAVRRV